MQPTADSKILVRATNWVGDAVMSIPALQALRAQYPHAHISILARPWVAGLYGREPFCDELVAYEAPRGTGGLRRKWRLARELQQKSFDCVILFPNSFEAAALAWLARIPLRIGYARDGRSPLLTSTVPIPHPGEIPAHQRFYYLELLKRAKLIDAYSTSDPIRLTGARLAAIEGRKKFDSVALRGPVIGIGPGAAYGSAKRWIPERFAQAAVEVANERRASVAVFGSREELPVCQIVQEQILRDGVPSVNFAGATTLSEFIDLAAACDLFITNDSGPMHIASALGVPTIAIFGSTDELATGPTGPNSCVIREPVECSPCLLRECPIDHRCMTAVTPSRVAQAAQSLDESAKSGRAKY